MYCLRNILSYVLITLTLWILGRFLPHFIGISFHVDAISQLVLCIVILPVAWYIARTESKRKYERCIAGNLIIFACIEATGILKGYSFVLMDGTPFSWTLLFLEIVYAGLCLYLAKYAWQKEKTKEQVYPDYQITKENSENSHIVVAKEAVSVEAHIQFCKKCGYKLLEGSAFCNKCGTAVDRLIEKCPACSKDLPMDAIYCQGCGYKVR